MDIRLAGNPFFPDRTIGNNATQAKMIELIGIRDHVRLPDIAILQMAYTRSPMNNAVEKRIEISTFFCDVFCLFGMLIFVKT